MTLVRPDHARRVVALTGFHLDTVDVNGPEIPTSVFFGEIVFDAEFFGFQNSGFSSAWPEMVRRP